MTLTHSVKTTIRKVDGEYQVRLYVDGKINKEATYFTSDKQDAINTARVMEALRYNKE